MRTFPRCLFAYSRAILLLCLAGSLLGSALGEIDGALTQKLWGMRYQVPEENLTNAGWLLLDDDGDGATNGAEIIAGTDPFKGGSVIKIASMALDGSGDVVFTFPSIPNKKYFLQSSNDLSLPGNWADVANKSVMGGLTEGVSQTITVTPAGNTFYRIRVADVDSDSDQVSDWAEKTTGYNPNSPSTDGRTSDMVAISASVASLNQVTVTATKTSATQPSGASIAAVETGSITVSRGIERLGSIIAPAITVSLQKVGSATEGVDYEGLPATVLFPAGSVAYQQGGGATDAVFSVVPKFNPTRRTNVTAILKAMPGTGYTVTGTGSASVVVNPAGLTDGTGLTAKYYNTSSSTYSPAQTNIFNGTGQMNRTDPVVDFGTSNPIANISLGNPACTITTGRDNALTTGDSVTIAGVVGGTFSQTIAGTFVVTVLDSTNFTIPVICSVVPISVTSATVVGANGWGTTAGPRGLSSPSVNAAFSVRWTGQILPQYSEKYFIDFRSDDSAKVWVNGLLLIDRWVVQGANDYVNTIDLTAGVPYDIQIDYWNSSAAAESKLYWWSASQPKQIIPKKRLFPAPAQNQKQTAVTSSLFATGYVGTPFRFGVVTPNISGTVTYAVDSNSGLLPPGLTLNTATGDITGTPTTVGSYNVAINAINAAAGGGAGAVTGSSVVLFTIFPTGSITRETLAGTTITADGTLAPPTYTGFFDDTDYPDNTSRRLRGYIVPPKTGNYYFWIDSNSSAELWISNDSESVNRVRRATVTRASLPASGKQTWKTANSQQTQWLSLVAGQKYYFEVLHNTGTDADDYLAVGWCQDEIGTVPSVTGDSNPTALTPVIANGGAALQGYPLSGTAPIYLFQPFDYPLVAPSTGTLYAANLGPQGAANTQASGSCNLQVNAAQTQAILYFNYQNLSSPKTAYHLHSDAFASHPAGEIIYDIDDVDSFHPELKTADGGYIWNLATTGTFTTVQQIREALATGKVYLNVHTTNYPAGEIRGNLTRVVGSQTPPDPAVYGEPSATDDPATVAQASRFLNQASFGASPTDVAYVNSNGFSAWIDDQLTKPASHTSNDVVAGLSADINTPYPSSLFTDTWWKYSITGSDQLRQRLAFALSEILVVSWNNNSGPLQNNGRILADYYDTLVDYCLPTSGLTDSGNFRGVLRGVTLTPAMGLYLDMRGNQKEDLTIGRHPNENYGREILQLFSVGLNRMWDDGKVVLNSKAELIPTYIQPNILGMASLLTGWNYAQPNQASGRLPTNFGPAQDFLNAMVLVPGQHDFVNPKPLLNNVVTPAATGITPRVTLSNITVASPCVVNTSTVHGLKVGDTVRISNVTNGVFSSPINAIHVVTEIVSATAFKVGLNCTGAPTAYTNAAVTGATVKPATYIGSLAAVTGSQADSSGTTLPHPYDQYGLTELDRAINNICDNDNVPPYICRQLIQRLVTSNPSPGYLYRVVQKWRDNGSGVRGDLGAVVKQILLDGEARSSSTAAANSAFGKQREPMLRLTSTARAFPARSYAGTYRQLPADTINANKFRLVTTLPNDFSAGFSVSLNFRDQDGDGLTSDDPSDNPTSTTYGISATLPIAATHLDISSVGTGNPTVITTAQPHGLPGPTNTVWPTGLSGQFSATINGAVTATMTGASSFTLPITTSIIFQVASVAVGTPCTVTTVAPHGLPAGTTTGVTINGVTGGAFVGSINSATLSVVNTGPNTFTVTGVNCTSPPTSYTTWREVSNPCLVTTQVPHGLNSGDSVTFANVSGGSFTPAINNATFGITKITDSSFTIASSCAVASTPNTGNIVGGNSMDVNATGMVNVAYTQPAGSSVMTVSTGGPQTDVAIPSPNSATTTLKSKVYLDILSGTAKSSASIASVAPGNPCTITTTAQHGLAGGEAVTIAGVSGGLFNPSINGTYTVGYVSPTQFTVLSNCTSPPTAATGTMTGTYGTPPADGVYLVDTVTGTTSFTVLTSDTPVAARSGNVIVPKISTSYTPLSSNTIVQYNNNVNHSMLVGQKVWVDVPIVGNPVADAEYTIATVIDEDHFTTSYLPVSSGLGTYPKPVNSNNGVTIYPLVAPPMGRGVDPNNKIKINQSTFNLGSTEGSLTQSPLNAPTVFNYFFPDYRFPGTLANNGVDSPEFQLSTDTNISNLTNSLTNMLIGTGGGNGNLNGLNSFNNGGGSVVMDLGSYMNLSRTQDSGIPTLIDDLAAILVGVPLEATTKTTILNFVAYRRTISNISQSSPCVITTSAAHGLSVGDQIAINDVTGGTYSGGSTGINGSFTVMAVPNGNQVTIGTAVAVPVAINCTNSATINYTNANVSNFPMNTPNPGPTNLQKRDRVRAIIHLIITSAEFAVQK